LPVPVAVGAALVGFFALFHGHAHGEEMGARRWPPMARASSSPPRRCMPRASPSGSALGRVLEAGQGRMVTRAAGALTVVGGILLAFPV
jgi:urease accessory protein